MLREAKLKICMLIVASATLGLSGCGGSDGAAGAAGAVGAAGPAGTDGATGYSCWDLNSNGIADANEDLNGDGVIDTLDCREPLPGTEINVSGKISTALGSLDRFAGITFFPAGTLQADPDAIGGVIGTVGLDGTYTIILAEGSYDILASRPGYEDVMELAFDVVDGGTNVMDFLLPEIPDTDYIGSEQCSVCHLQYYETFAQTGHPFKLNKVVDGQQPVYPFTSLTGVLERITDEDGTTDNTLGTPMTWEDVTYVIGGYNWKARFIDADGAIVTGSEVQYNFATDGMSGYHDNEVDKPYNCGNCHTTGWVHQDDLLSPDRQDGLPFMHGTFTEPGVHCEACHGSGAKHTKFRGGMVVDATPRTLLDLTADDAGFGKPVDCGECHTRDGERDYPAYTSGFDNALLAAEVADTRPNEMGGRIAAKGGFIRHHEQYDEILGIDPDSLLTTRSNSFLAAHGNCMNCHNPHGSAVKDDHPLYTGIAGVDHGNTGCTTCHADYSPDMRDGGMQNLECVDCHMPKLGKSAVAFPPVAEGAPSLGDVSSHIFSIDVLATTPQFTEDGGFAYPALTNAYACETCHNASLFPLPDTFYETFTFHNNIL